MHKIELTDAEWMCLIDGRRRGGLQKCCANISDLRDQIVQMARDGGELGVSATFFLRAYRASADGHDGLDAVPALVKIRDACLAERGMTLAELLEESHADRGYAE